MNTIHRKSYTSLNKIYFLTATIHKWLPLLESKENKELIINYLKKLSDENKIVVYGFVIMPNHVHIIWKQNDMNGKETPQGSFLKYTAHEFLKSLKLKRENHKYAVVVANKQHEIWQRDSLSIEIYSKEVAKQKLNYIHFNPVNGKWALAKDDLDYYYSSARFYENGVNEFGFLKIFFKYLMGIKFVVSCATNQGVGLLKSIHFLKSMFIILPMLLVKIKLRPT